jgi:transcriptional regulator with XRE-family HTH domain
MVSRKRFETAHRFESAEVLTEMGFPDRLAVIRQNRGYSQKSLAEAAGLSQIQVHRYERGQSQPTLEAIKRLAQVLSVSSDELIFDEDERGPSDELRLHFEAIAAFDPEDRKIAKALLESLILRHQARQLTSIG